LTDDETRVVKYAKLSIYRSDLWRLEKDLQSADHNTINYTDYLASWDQKIDDECNMEGRTKLAYERYKCEDQKAKGALDDTCKAYNFY